MHDDSVLDLIIFVALSFTIYFTFISCNFKRKYEEKYLIYANSSHRNVTTYTVLYNEKIKRAEM